MMAREAILTGHAHPKSTKRQYYTPFTSDRPRKKTKVLLEDDSSDDEDSGSGGVPVKQKEISSNNHTIAINREYAERFEHNKKREELQQLEAKYASDVSTESTDSEDEDDDGIFASEALDAQIQATIQAIRVKDPRVYDEKTKFYSDSDDEQQENSTIAKIQTKPMYLSDYHRENLLKGDVGAEVEDEQPLTYAQQQDDLRRTVIKEMHSVATGVDIDSAKERISDEDDDFLVKRVPQTGTEKSNILVIKTAIKLDPQTAERDPETFLSNFLSTKAWVGTDGSKLQPFESDDEEEERRADLFEEAYNLRFEDPKGSNEKLLSHARDAAAKYSVRKEQSNSRKKARELERAKKEAEMREREAEKARLRKLRIAEAEEKIKKIKDAAGLNSTTLEEQDWATFIDEVWDDDRWEQEMKQRFGDEYYADRELDGGDGAGTGKRKLKKPKWDADIEIQDIVPDFEKEEAANPTLSLVHDPAVETPMIQQSDDEPPGDLRRSTKQALKKEKAEQKKDARQQRRRIEDIVDQKLKVDDTLSGFGTKHTGHFRYRETSPITFGLTANDILMASDSQLNEFAGLKKMATFRDKEKKVKDKKRLGKKARLRQWRKETFGDENGPQKTLAEVLESHTLGDVPSAAVEHQGGDARGGKKARSRKRARSDA